MVGVFRGYGACMIAVAALLLATTFESRAATDDSKICAKESGEIAIDACSRAIKSGRYKGRDLARQFMYRGVEQGLKKDYDLALADYGEAIRIDKKYSDAFYNRCVVYNLKEEYDRALAEANESLRLGPKGMYGLKNRGMSLENKGELAEAEKRGKALYDPLYREYKEVYDTWNPLVKALDAIAVQIRRSMESYNDWKLEQANKAKTSDNAAPNAPPRRFPSQTP